LAYASDYQIRQNSTSGGIATALSIYALEKQLVDAVAGTRIKKGTINETETVLCRSRKDVESVKGSKYCPAAANCVFRKAAEENVGSLMFVGLPCHIQGLYRARKVKPLKEIKSLLTIGLLCGGMSGQEATEWILKRYGIDRDKVKAITCYRGRGFPGKMVVEINGNQEIEIPYLDYYDEYFESWRPWRCLLCLDRSSQLADISLGDAWLPEVMSEPAGTSIIIARTKEGMNLIENAIKDGVISCEVASSETILKSQQGLWKEIEQKVKETLDLCKTVRKSIPSHDVDIPSQSLTKRARRLKYLLRMTMLRKMSTSPVFFFWIESLRKAKAAALAMVKST
jgi:coenzyme F420 hydrogenase subunit beta